MLARGLRVGKERERQLMQRHGIRTKGRKKFVETTDSKHQLPVAPDLVQRRFTPAAPNLVWSGDITYVPTDEGWLYLAAVLDLHSPQVVGWSLQPHMQTALVRDALLMACFRRRPAPGADRPQRPGQPVLQPRLPGHAQGLATRGALGSRRDRSPWRWVVLLHTESIGPSGREANHMDLPSCYQPFTTRSSLRVSMPAWGTTLTSPSATRRPRT